MCCTHSFELKDALHSCALLTLGSTEFLTLGKEFGHAVGVQKAQGKFFSGPCPWDEASSCSCDSLCTLQSP
eukprot:c31351_g1_i1 orf=3-212(-)